MAQLTIRWHSI